MSEVPAWSDISDSLNYWPTGSGSWCPRAGLGFRVWERRSEGRPLSSFSLGNSLEGTGTRSQETKTQTGDFWVSTLTHAWKEMVFFAAEGLFLKK